MLNSNVNHGESEITYALPMETLGTRIRMLRNAKGLTQDELAKRVGGTTTKAAVSMWENDEVKDIRLKTVLALAEVLGTTIEYLVHGPVAGREPGQRRGASSRS